MTPSMMTDATNQIDAYIQELLPWQKEIVVKLRKIVHEADPEVIEDWKWGKPAFSHKGLLCWIWAFQKWVSFTLYLGSLVEDKYKIYNHGSFMDRNRSIAFTNVSQIKDKYLIEYIKKAVTNNIAGKKVVIKSRENRQLFIPKDITELLKKKNLQDKFDVRPPYQKRDYISWITSAKLPETREKRFTQMIDELSDGTKYMGMVWKRGK